MMIYLFISLMMIQSFADNTADKSRSEQGKTIKFGIVADAQFADKEPAGTRYYRASLHKLQEAYEAFRSESVDFVINLGDVIDGDYESFKPVIEIIDSSGIKTYHITGNHDYAVDEKLKNNLPLSMPGKNGYYSFQSESFTFIFLNGNESSSYISTRKNEIKEAEEYLAVLRSVGAINAREWNGKIGDKQLSWLEDELNKAEAEERKVLLFCHFPVYPENEHNLLNYKEVLNLLASYENILAWFNGHNHQGNYGDSNGTHFITFRGMVETPAENSFAIVELNGSTISIKGFGRQKSRTIRLF